MQCNFLENTHHITHVIMYVFACSIVKKNLEQSLHQVNI
jgi:hypothetical protein